MKDKLNKIPDVSSGEPCRKSGVVTVSISVGMPTGEIVWAKAHTDSPEGKAFLLLSLQRKMRKREYRKLQSLISKGKKENGE